MVSTFSFFFWGGGGIIGELHLQLFLDGKFFSLRSDLC